MTTLICVRHGQSESNLAKRFTGQTETVLTPLGHAQAENTARFLHEYPIDVIYSSDLERAMQTAEPTAKDHGLEIIPNRELREIFAGEWEGLLYATLTERFPESYRRWREDVGHAHPDGGESALALGRRVSSEVDRLLAKHQGQCIALFTHATPLRMLACRWFGRPFEDAASVPWCNNASVSVIEYEDDGSFQVLLYGYDEHQGKDSTHFPKGAV